jgi:hypothetical protein
MGFSLTLPSWVIGTFVPTSMSYKLNTNNQTFINRKEGYACPIRKPQTTKYVHQQQNKVKIPKITSYLY